MELKHLELFLDGEKLDSVWYEGEKLWPAPVIEPEPAPEPREVRTVLIENVQHFYGLLAWEFMRERGMVDGEYEATGHTALDIEMYEADPELYFAYLEWMGDLTELPVIPDTSQATDLSFLFSEFSSLTSVPDLDARRAVSFDWMFTGCKSLTDGNVRVIVEERPNNRALQHMISNSGLTRLPFYLPDGTPL